MKTISIKQPWANLICSGLKPIENRTWATKFRGLVLVHASAKFDYSIFRQDTDSEIWEAFIKSSNYSTGAIIGSVEIVDCVVNHPSIWAEKSGPKPIDYLTQTYNWVLANPVLFAKPITNVKGKLSFWEYPIELCHVCGQPTELICEVCEKPYCEKHSAKYDQFTQIDFDCCSECAESNKWIE